MAQQYRPRIQGAGQVSAQRFTVAAKGISQGEMALKATHSNHTERCGTQTATEADMLSSNSYISFAGRILIVIIFLCSGVGKIGAPSMIMQAISSVGLPAPLVGLVLSIIVEIGGGLCLALGV